MGFYYVCFICEETSTKEEKQLLLILPFSGKATGMAQTSWFLIWFSVLSIALCYLFPVKLGQDQGIGKELWEPKSLESCPMHPSSPTVF